MWFQGQFHHQPKVFLSYPYGIQLVCITLDFCAITLFKRKCQGDANFIIIFYFKMLLLKNYLKVKTGRYLSFVKLRSGQAVRYLGTKEKKQRDATSII
jgi:hypothetical protein